VVYSANHRAGQLGETGLPRPFEDSLLWKKDFTGIAVVRHRFARLDAPYNPTASPNILFPWYGLFAWTDILLVVVGRV